MPIPTLLSTKHPNCQRARAGIPKAGQVSFCLTPKSRSRLIPPLTLRHLARRSSTLCARCCPEDGLYVDGRTHAQSRSFVEVAKILPIHDEIVDLPGFERQVDRG